MSLAFQVQLLGTNSALPLHGRNTTAQYLQFGRHYFLIDCGEGTQHQLQKFKVKRNKISHIFISHLHGDHIYGLPGLLGSYAHFSRSEPLVIYGPAPIKNLLETTFAASEAHFSYDLIIEEINHEAAKVLTLDEEHQVTFFPLKHRIPTIGFRFDFNPLEKNIRKEAISAYNLDVEQIVAIKKGRDLILPDGTTISNDLLTYKRSSKKSYGYCSDCIYDEEVLPYIEQVDLLYHETTYLSDLEKEARERMHSTLGQAIKISQLARAKKLITGHYSSRYSSLGEFEVEAENSSQDVSIGNDGDIYIF